MAKTRERLAKAVAVVGLILTVGCGSQKESVSVDSTDNHRAEDVGRSVFQAQSRTVSAGDLDALAHFGELTGRWNSAAAGLVRDYLDPNVSPEQWVQSASADVGALRAVWLEMQAFTIAIQDPGIRKVFDSFTLNYRAKLDGITSLHNAVALGDMAGEENALQRIGIATTEGNDMARSMIERLRPFIDPQVLSEELRKRGKTIGDLMKPTS